MSEYFSGLTIDLSIKSMGLTNYYKLFMQLCGFSFNHNLQPSKPAKTQIQGYNFTGGVLFVGQWRYQTKFGSRPNYDCSLCQDIDRNALHLKIDTHIPLSIWHLFKKFCYSKSSNQILLKITSDYLAT